nr:putative ribonuclease H-like domain-containing protein [Tanacetum cinerariifolium]
SGNLYCQWELSPGSGNALCILFPTPIETFTSNALVSQCDGIGSYDWSYQVEEEPTNFDLMAISSSSAASDNKLSLAKPAQDLSHTTRPMAPIIEDWVSDTEDESKPNDSQNASSFIQPIEHVKPFGHSDQHVEAPILPATPKPTSSKTICSSKKKNRKTFFVCRSVDYLIKDCTFHAKPKTQPTPRNNAHMGYNKQHASFTKKYPQKHIVPAAVLTKSKPVSITVVRQCNPSYALKDKGVIDSGCSWHMTGNMSYLSNFQELNGRYVAFGGNHKGGKILGKGKIKTGTGPTWLFDIDSLTRTINYQPVTTGNQTNPSAGDDAFDEKEHDAEKPESAVNLSSSSSALSGEKDDMTKKKDKGKIPTAGQNYFKNTNPISAAGPSNYNTSPTHGKFLLRDASQPPHMLESEDIVYSDHEDDGAEADFNNLKTSITLRGTQEVDLPLGKRVIGTKWVYRNKKDEKGIVVRNKARLVAQVHTQEEGINYKVVFAPVARIKAIRLFLAYASFIGFMVYQMDVKSAFLYGTIEEEVYVCQPLGFEDLDHPDKVYTVVKELYGLHQAPRAWKFGLTKGKSASTPIDTEKPLLKDPDGEDVDVHTYSKEYF